MSNNWAKYLNVLKPFGQGIASSYASGDDPATGIGKGFGRFLGGKIADKFNPDDSEQLPPNPRYEVKSQDMEQPVQRGNWAQYLNPASEFIPTDNIQPIRFNEDDFDQPPLGGHEGFSRALTNANRPRIVSNPEKKNLSPLEMSSNRLNEALNRDTSNKDSGAKAWFKEFLGNTGAGMQEARRLNPNAGFLENLGSSLGTGLAGGTVVRDMNEKRQKEQDVQRAMQEYGVQKQLSDDQIGQNFKKAQLGELERRPEKEVQDFLNKQTLQNDRFKQQTEMEAKRQSNRIAAILKKDELNKGKYKIEAMKDGSGRLIKKYPDREEPFLDPDTGEQLTDPFERGYEYTTESGQKVKIKGNQIASVEAAKAFRDSMMGWNQTKYNSDIEGENADDAAKYQAELNKANAERSGYDAQIKGIDDQMSFLSQQNDALRKELDSIAPDVSEDGNRRRAQIQSTIAQNDSAFTKLKGERGQAEGKRKAVADPVRPKPRQKISAPNTGKPVPKTRDPLGLFQN